MKSHLLLHQYNVMILQEKADMSRMSLSIVFQRSSALFQLQLGMVLRFIAGQQLGQSLLVLQLLIHNHLM